MQYYAVSDVFVSQFSTVRKAQYAFAAGLSYVDYKDE